MSTLAYRWMVREKGNMKIIHHVKIYLNLREGGYGCTSWIQSVTLQQCKNVCHTQNIYKWSTPPQMQETYDTHIYDQDAVHSCF